MTSPGTEFEIEVFHALQRVLREGSLGLDPECSRIFHHRPYYSSTRKKGIYFDIAIELTLPRASAVSFLWIWECKSYKKLVPVDDIEEFESKLNQVGAANTKGTMISRNGFQQSTLEFAKSTGVGLARLMPQAQIEWILYRATPAELDALSASREEILRALIQSDFTARNQEFFGLSTGFRTLRNLTFDRYVRLQLEEWGFRSDR
jgi:hypothetical protein